MAKASGLRGRRAGPGAPEPLELVEGFVPLCHAACVTLSEEWATVLRPLAGQCRGAPEPWTLGMLGSSSALGLDWR